MAATSPGAGVGGGRTHEYLLKFLLVGDSDVGKHEILDLLDDGVEPVTSSFCNQHATITPKIGHILLEGKIVKLQLWDASGQGRFSTIFRSYSRGAQGILIVYDITSRWSFQSIDRWLKEVDEQAPGIPKILIGNRLHLEFRRQVSREEAEQFSARNKMEYFEVSTLAAFNINESLTELSRLVMTRNGMQRLYKHNRVSSLQDGCCRTIVRSLRTVHDITRLPLPARLQLQIRSFANSSQLTANHHSLHRRTGSDMSGGGGFGTLPRQRGGGGVDHLPTTNGGVSSGGGRRSLFGSLVRRSSRTRAAIESHSAHANGTPDAGDPVVPSYSSNMAASVRLHVYEITQGMAGAMSMSLLGRHIEGVWHTGVFVYGNEYFFGGGGIDYCPSGGTILGRPTEVIELGETEIPFDLFQEYLMELASGQFSGDKYHLLDHNCNTFSNEVAVFLTGKPIPEKITNLPGDVMDTPFGQMMRPFVDNMMGRLSGGHATAFAPLPNAAPATAPLDEANTGPGEAQPPSTAPGHAKKNGDDDLQLD